jgi:hypothetical protein
MTDSIVILLLAVVGFLAFLCLKIVQRARAANEERRRTLQVLGFEPLAPPPAEVTEPIVALHGGKKTLARVFERRGSADRLYLFDLRDSSGEGSVHEALAVFSPRLDLPRFTISPRLEGGGRLVALGNRVIEMRARRRGPAVEFPSHPEFARRHFVNAPDAESVHRLLTSQRLDRLTPLGQIVVEAEGRVFSVQRIRLGRRAWARTDPHKVAERVHEAEELLRALGG